jgi:hypothetical protein
VTPDRVGCDELREMASDCGRSCKWCLLQSGFFDRSRGSLVFLFHRWSSDCPRAIVFGVIPLIRGNQSEACVPPVLFDLATGVVLRWSILNLSYILGGSNAI